MGKAKWIAGFLGWVSGGPIGALIGFALGAFVDLQINLMKRLNGGTDTGGLGGGWQQTTTSSRGYTSSQQRNSFMVSLLVLSSAVIRADGYTRHAELEHVRKFIRQNFGDNMVDEAMNILTELNRKQVNIYEVGAQIADNMNYSQRLQLFHYLTQIARADGEFTESEKSVLEAIAGAIRLSSSDAASIIAMYYKGSSGTGSSQSGYSVESAYAVLEISPSATDDEVKSAYRRMAMKHHPDKVATLGPEVQKAAAEKFRKIQEAYETIKQERGIK
ncbi:MAG: TerB family tellurite resistance protein [Bacteroidales bacterium]|nr:TerB family tellurite resistance protein [Bacteroidales bacterium]